MTNIKLEVLKKARGKYNNLCWTSGRGGKRTYITSMDDDYLQNVLRMCAEKALIAERHPDIDFLQEYEGIKYSEYVEALRIEYLYRQEVIEEQYREYMDNEVYRQSVRDREYYDDKYDYGALGDIY